MGKQNKKSKENQEKLWQRRKGVGSFPTWTIRWIREKMRKSQTKGGGKEKGEKREKNRQRGEERGRKEKGDFLGIPTVESRRSES